MPSLGLKKERLDIHAVYVPEGEFDVDAEAARLKPLMDKVSLLLLLLLLRLLLVVVVVADLAAA